MMRIALEEDGSVFHVYKHDHAPVVGDTLVFNGPPIARGDDNVVAIHNQHFKVIKRVSVFEHFIEMGDEGDGEWEVDSVWLECIKVKHNE